MDCKSERQVILNMRKLSFVIPCYRSEHTIEGVVEEIRHTMSAKISEYDYEIVLVSDYSPDNVWEVIKALAMKDSKVRGLQLSKNFGQHSALMAGYGIAMGDIVITLDDDGQTPANEVFQLVEELEKGYDVVYGYYAERQDGLFRKFGTAVNNFMSETMIGKPKDVHLTSYFAARKYIIEEIIKYNNPFPYIWGLVVRTTKNISNVPITHRVRKDGTSGYTLGKLLGLWMNGFTAFSVKPLRIATICGCLCAAFGFIGIIYTIVMKLITPDMVAGYSSLMAVLLFIGGMLMLMLGLVGEYIGRIYICINNSPQYVIKERIN